MISKYFKRKEFACKCGCGFESVDKELLAVLEDVREHFGNRIFITSGNRCDKHNKKVGGAVRDGISTSKHTMGIAVDFKVEFVSAREVADYLEETYPGKYGIGRYSTWTHIDVRSGDPARWGKN